MLDKREWLLDGYKVTRLCFDFQFRILIWGMESGQKSSLEVIVEAPFVVVQDDIADRYDPGQIDTMKGALAILHKPVEKLAVYRSGQLELTLSEQIELIVEKDAEYESWEVHGTGKWAKVQMLCSAHDGPPWIED